MIVYDQDKTMVVSKNLGEVIYVTQEELLSESKIKKKYGITP